MLSIELLELTALDRGVHLTLVPFNSKELKRCQDVSTWRRHRVTLVGFRLTPTRIPCRNMRSSAVRQLFLSSDIWTHFLRKFHNEPWVRAFFTVSFADCSAAWSHDWSKLKRFLIDSEMKIHDMMIFINVSNRGDDSVSFWHPSHCSPEE